MSEQPLDQIEVGTTTIQVFFKGGSLNGKTHDVEIAQLGGIAPIPAAIGNGLDNDTTEVYVRDLDLPTVSGAYVYNYSPRTNPQDITGEVDEDQNL